MRSCHLVLAVMLSCFVAAPAQAQDIPVIVEINPLSLSTAASARIIPSPDGQMVAYDSAVRLNSHVDRYLTLSTVEPGDEPDYHERPEELPRGFDSDAASVYIPFAWSPDSTRLAVSSQPLVSLADTDLWVFNLADNSWTNLAEDGYSGPLAEPGAAAPGGTVIDIQPAWSPDGATIAVERTIIGEDGSFGMPQITYVDATTGAAHDLTALPGGATTGATASMDWSADGDRLALTLLRRQPDMERDGLWLVDAESGEAEQVLSLTEIEAAVHAVIPELVMTSVGPVIWSPDNQHLLLWAGTTLGTPAQVWPFIVNAETSDIESAPVPAHPRDTGAARGLRPLQAAWSPDGSQLLIYTFGLHPDEDRTSLDPNNSSVRGALRLSDIATGESQLLGYLPLGTTPFYYAEWGSDGHVVINGYHLALE